MKVLVISIMVVALGTISQRLIKELEDFEIREKVETILTRELLRSTRMPKRDLQT